MIELVGETGTGKSRLLAEARALGDDMTILHTTCEVVTRETPYFAWRDLLRQLLGAEWDDPEERVLERLQDQISRSDPDLLPWLPLIAIAVGLQVPPTTEVNQLAPEAQGDQAPRGRPPVPSPRAGVADDRRGRARTPDGCRVGCAVHSADR